MEHHFRCHLYNPGWFRASYAISMHTLLCGCLHSIVVFPWWLSQPWNSALTSQPREREAYPRVGHGNLISYVHMGCILMESHAGYAIDACTCQDPGAVELMDVACSVAKLLAAREGL